MMFPTFRHQKTDMLASGAFERAVTFSSPGPTGVRTWATILQSRIAVHDNPLGSTAGMEKLQLGEQNVILLAETAQTEIVLLDEKAAHRVTGDRGLRGTETLGVLGEAAARGLRKTMFGKRASGTKRTSRYSRAALISRSSEEHLVPCLERRRVILD